MNLITGSALAIFIVIFIFAAILKIKLVFFLDSLKKENKERMKVNKEKGGDI